MYEFHRNRRRYFDIQVKNSRESVIPFIENYFSLPPGAKILEVGCGEGGVLKGFIEKDHTGVGVELEEGRARDGAEWMKEEVRRGSMRFIVDDIFTVCPKQLGGPFHLVILKDVIEHLHDKKTLFRRLKEILHPSGVIFFGFPPWQMPFGGHQQVCNSKYLSRFTWLHLLPLPVYKKILTMKKEPVTALMDIYNCRVSIEGFERMAKRNGFDILGKKHFLIAPIYRYKFGWREREQPVILRHLPYLRNLYTTAVYYLVVPSVSE
jgi:SAM-dependent methyltransferase